MHDYGTKQRTPTLLIDIEKGEILEAPPEVVVSERYCESHPFIEMTRLAGETFIIAGPDANQVAHGAGGRWYTQYRVDREVDGFLYAQKER